MRRQRKRHPSLQSTEHYRSLIVYQSGRYIESLRDTCKEALGIHVSIYFEHKLEFAKISKAWNSAKVTAETKQKIDAVHRAHGEPEQMLEGDWANMTRAFKLKYGKQIHLSRLPAQSYFEAYEERLPNTTWKAETLAHVVSLQEEESQKALRPEPPQLSVHSDAATIHGKDAHKHRGTT